MTEQASPLVTFYKQGWEHYQQALVKTIASLSSEQLALPIEFLHTVVAKLGDKAVVFTADGDPDRDVELPLRRTAFSPLREETGRRGFGRLRVIAARARVVE